MGFGSDTKRVNRATFAGRWYSADPDRLRRELDSFVKEVSVEEHGTDGKGRSGADSRRSLAGAILPHAGLSYSGSGMAEAFARLDPGTVDHVVLLSPSHYARLDPNRLYVEAFTEHQTPLGPIRGTPHFWQDAIEKGADRKVDAGKLLIAEELVEGEHGTELFFPFLRHTLGPEATLTLVIVPELTTLDELSNLADLLDSRVARRVGWERTFLIMSSDFTHYGPGFRYIPFGTENADEIEARVAAEDTAVARAAAERDVEALFDRFHEERTTVCGRFPILLGTELLRRRNRRGRVARYYNSNAFGRRGNEFVCYASVLFERGSDS